MLCFQWGVVGERTENDRGEEGRVKQSAKSKAVVGGFHAGAARLVDLRDLCDVTRVVVAGSALLADAVAPDWAKIVVDCAGGCGITSR